jgi:hypothetical protein
MEEVDESLVVLPVSVDNADEDESTVVLLVDVIVGVTSADPEVVDIPPLELLDRLKLLDLAELGTDIVLKLFENDWNEDEIALLLTAIELIVVEDEFSTRLVRDVPSEEEDDIVWLVFALVRPFDVDVEEIWVVLQLVVT